MKYSKSIFKMLLVFLFLAQNSFATTPIPGVGIVVKKNNCLPNPCKSTCNHGGAIIFTTGASGSFSTQLEIGEYELSFPQDQLQIRINSIVKSNFPKSNYQYDGSGVEMVLDNSQITVNAKATKGNMFAIDKQNSSITIKVPKGGATLSGKLGWNDDVLKKSEISCPDGFIMQNGECVPINNAGNQQARTEGKTKGKIIKSGNNGMISASLNVNGGTSSSTGVDNSLSFNPSLGIAIHWKNFGIGLDAGTFNTKPDFDFDAYAAPLQNLDFLTITNTKNDWTSTYFVLGPQYTIPLSPSQNKESGRHTPFHNKLTFTLALKGGLTINKAPEFSVMDKSTPPKSIASYTAPQDYKTNAFSLKPSIGFNYWISENFALTANAQYLMQTGQKEFTTGYRDLTNVNLAPPISPIQFQENIATAPRVMTTTKGPENYMSFGFGITYCFRKGWDGSIKGNKTVENTSNETQRKGWDGSIKGKNVAEKGITENGLKKNDVETSPIDGDGIKTKENNPNDNSGEPEQQVYLFSNGCTRTCTGNWYANSDGSVGCDGTAGPRVCINKTVTTTPSATARVKKRLDIKTQDFDKDGNPTDKKGWDGTIKGKNIAEKGINENGLKKNDAEQLVVSSANIKDMLVPKSSNGTNSNVTTMMIKGMGETTAEGAPIVVGNTLSGNIKMVKGVSNAGILIEMIQKENGDYVAGYTDKNGDFLLGRASDSLHTASINGVEYGAIKIIGNTKDNTETTVSRKGITEGGLKKNETEYVLTDAEVKAIAETLVTMRKGWDGSIKGNIAEKKGIKEKGLKKNEAKSENINLVLTSTAQTLVNLARNGWDGSIKGNKVENAANEADVKSIAETLVNIRKGWDGSIKGNKVENVANEADIKMIAEAFVNLRKGWDGTIKGKNIAEKGIQENGLKKNDVETSTVNDSKAIIENPNDNSGEPGQQVYLFSNGCTRTCTGNWYANSDGSVGCDGTAGPRVCINKTVTTTPSATARVRKSPDMKTEDFDQDGNPTDKKGWDGSIKGNIMANVGSEESGDNIESIHIKVTITTKVGFTDCESPGYFFCIGVEIGALANDHNLGDLPLEKDQLITNSNVALVNDNIIKVTSTGVKSTISEKTISEFANKTQKNKEFTLDKNVLNEICKALNLNTPNEPVIFRAEDQKYEVINTKNEGKEVQILEIHQKTKIKIDGKEYTLSILTTSGKGLNSPKN